MADAKLTALTAASALAGADLFYVSQSAASRKATGTQLLALVGTAYVPLAGGATMTGALTLPAGAVGAPALMFTGAGATTGLYSTGSNNISAVVNGVQIGYFNTNTFWAAGTAGIGILATSGYLALGGNSADPTLRRESFGIASFRSVTGTQQNTLQIYNTYTDASNYERLTLTGVAGTSVNITAETLGTGGDNIDIVLTPAGTGAVVIGSATITPTLGVFTGAAFSSPNASLNYEIYGLNLHSSSVIAWTSGVIGDSQDAGFGRNAAGVVEVNNGTAGTWRDLKLRNLIQTEYSQLTEMTAPAAPAANSVRIYAEDNGSGKTRLMALFATGSAVQIAIEP